jgi:putative ABC transport system substrate-binding protein
MKRREFIALLSGTAAAWPLAARAQRLAVPLIGYIGATSPSGDAHLNAAFVQGLKESDLVEGQNVAIEYRWAEGYYNRMPSLVDDLIRHKVAVIAAVGGTPSALAAKAATTTIPIVFAIGVDPVKFGLVQSFNRPGGNITGVVLYTGLLGAKRLALLRELVPTAEKVAILANPDSPVSGPELKDVQAAAGATGHDLHVVTANSNSSLESAFAKLAELQAGAMIVGADPFFYSRRETIVAAAARLGIPAIYELREFVVAGGLMSYGASLAGGYRQAGTYVGKIVKGEKPADLPVIQPTKFELIINLKTANALGLTVPSTLQVNADEVIE